MSKEKDLRELFQTPKISICRKKSLGCPMAKAASDSCARFENTKEPRAMSNGSKGLGELGDPTRQNLRRDYGSSRRQEYEGYKACRLERLLAAQAVEHYEMSRMAASNLGFELARDASC